jgi:hypothetical protein
MSPPFCQAGVVTVSLASALAGNSTKALGLAGAAAGCAIAGSADIAIKVEAASMMGFMGVLALLSEIHHCPILDNWKGPMSR